MAVWPIWLKAILGLLGLVLGFIAFLLLGWVIPLPQISPQQMAVGPTATSAPTTAPIAAARPTATSALPTATTALPTTTSVPPTATAVAAAPTVEADRAPVAELTPAPAAYPQRPAQGLTSAGVTRVVDGDTVEVLAGAQRHTIRLIGIDTPDATDPRTPVQCFGPEASDRAKELLEEQTVWLETDSSQSDRDQYGRSLRYVWLADGRLFNLEMVRGGYAHEYTFQVPYRYQESFKRAQAEAREQNQGLWSSATCGGVTAKPADPPVPPQAQTVAKPAAPTPTSQVAPKPTTGGRGAPVGANCPASQPIKGNQGSRSTTEWIYHLPGGGSYAQTVPEECFATEAQAQTAGYRRARN